MTTRSPPCPGCGTTFRRVDTLWSHVQRTVCSAVKEGRMTQEQLETAIDALKMRRASDVSAGGSVHDSPIEGSQLTQPASSIDACKLPANLTSQVASNPDSLQTPPSSQVYELSASSSSSSQGLGSAPRPASLESASPRKSKHYCEDTSDRATKKANIWWDMSSTNDSADRHGPWSATKWSSAVFNLPLPRPAYSAFPNQNEHFDRNEKKLDGQRASNRAVRYFLFSRVNKADNEIQAAAEAYNELDWEENTMSS